MSSREVRLGLVLYGGVSLAIYENGIVQEIYRAICGDGVYGLIRELIDSDIVVDVISGTSAGGVNGVMLGYSLANGFDFLKSPGLWRELGDIEKLLRKPDDKDDASLLDSNYYQEQLRSCYAETLTSPTDGRVAPTIGELDLFVTGTDANGVISTVYDDLGHPIDVKNHRALFQLQYRGARKNDFKNPGSVTPDDMATLSRLTSGFPVAFKPISIGERDEDPNFYRWGKLSGPAVYMDGGILNNKPFTSTIGAIASRTATREVERFLIYVEPSPEQFAMPTGIPETPTIVQAGIRSLTSIPAYQSIAADLQSIEAHNERATRIQKILESLGDALETGKECLSQATVVPAADDPCGDHAYLVARLLMVRDAAVEAILNSPNGIREYFQSQSAAEEMSKQAGKAAVKPEDKRRSGRLLVQSFWKWKGDPDKTLVDYDVFFRKRRADYLTGVLMRATKTGDSPAEIPQEAWETVNHYFKLYEIAEWAMRKWVTEWISGWESLSAAYPELDSKSESERNEKLEEISRLLWGQVQVRLDRLMSSGIEVAPFDPTSSESLVAAREEYYTKLKVWTDSPPEFGVAPVPMPDGPHLLKSLDRGLQAAIAGLEGGGLTGAIGGLLRREFCRFLAVDRQILPIQIGSGFESTDVIRVVRFSPLDAQRGMSRGRIEDKVRGTALANFGAFFKKGWRANDIMMGRLDAACLLTECLLTKERLAAVAARGGGPGQPYAIIQDLIDRTLPKGGTALTSVINAYFADPVVEKWERMIDAIVAAAHAGIVMEEWPQVAQCTLDQQYAWGQYQADASLPETLKFPGKATQGQASPDELLVRIAAECISKGKLPPFDPQTNKKRPLDEEVPLVALQEHASLALVRLGRSILASIPAGKAREAVGGSIAFKVTMQWVPEFFYRLVLTRRTQPGWMLVPITMFLNLALIGVLILAWSSELKHNLSVSYAVLATAGVAAAVLAEWALTRKRVVSATAGLIGAIALVTALGAVAGFWMKHPVSAAGEHQMSFVVRCILSVVVIALPGAIPSRSFLIRLVGAALAGLVLLEWVWK